MEKLKKIGDLIRALKNIGINMSIDNIRKLEGAGIIPCTHINGTPHRRFTEEQLQKSVRNLCYYYLGASIEEIKQNGEVLKSRGRKIIKIAKSLVK